jgi:hypothetical protein
MGPPGRHSGEGHATYDAPSAAAHRGDPLSTGPDGQERRSVPRDGETGPDGRREPGPADGAGTVPERPARPGYSPVRAGPSSERPVRPGDGAARPVIAVDAMGGDHAPGEIVAGALAA